MLLLVGGSRQTFRYTPPALYFSTSASRRYTVRYCTNLVDGVWQDLDPAFPGTGSEMTVPDSAAGSQRFYRLRIELP